MKQLLILTALLFSFLSVTLAQSSDMGGNTDTPPTVTFNKNPIIVGIGAKRSSQTPDYPATIPPTLSHQVKATIAPKAKAGGVTFTISNSARATVSPVSRIDVGDTTEVILLVTGVTETPATAKDGDTDVQAVYKEKIVSTAKVKVLTPKTRKNDVPAKPTAKWNSVDRDPATGVPTLYRSTVYYDVEITVYDQFGNILDSIYNGSGVAQEILVSSTGNTGLMLMDEPDKEFINGVKIDRVEASPKFVETNLVGTVLPITARDVSLWETWKKEIGGFNNLFAGKPGIMQLYVQAIVIDTHLVTPNYERTLEAVAVDFPDAPLKVTDKVRP